MSTTPNMNLTLPTVSQTPGPTWANQINADLSVLDAHNHNPSVNGGVAITTAALSIDADLSFGTYSAIGVGSVELINQASTPSASRVYVTGGNLWYSYDGSTPVQITSGTSIAASAGNITGLAAPAAVIYDNATSRFTFWSNQPAGTQGILAASQIWLRASSATGIIAVAASPSPSTYTLTLPPTTPSGAGLVGFANSGVLSPVVSDGTLSITSSTIGVTPLGITSAQLALNAVQTANINNNAVQTAKINDKAVTQVKMEDKSPSTSGAISYTVTGSTSYVSIPNGTLAISAIAGRPVFVWLQSQDNVTGNLNSVNDPSGSDIRVWVVPPSGASYYINQTTLGTGSGYSPSYVSCMFVASVTGVYNLFLQGKNNSSAVGAQLAISNVFLKAFQL